mmetsp:Transcript_29216/g.100789  ORF Transcript_29216/g.100789 Transcript_29216/m.100789 type:complete len:208 (+) Transcript_29216:61-684(+)
MAAVVAALKAKRRRHLAKLQLDRDRAESDARRAFPDFDASGQGLDSSELQRLLQKLQPDSEIDHALVDYVYHLGCRKHGVERISPECMRDILQYTKYYLGKVQWLDDIFAKFDTDRSGTLDRSQLKRALIDVEKQNAEKRAYKSGAWLTHEHEITDADLDEIIAASDWDHSGVLPQEQALLAMLLWSALASKSAEEHAKKSASCNLQ